MKLYYHHFASPTVRKVRAVAFQLDLKLDEIRVDYDAREHQSAAYRALNPNSKFPTLADGDFVLWESSAICQYLATRVPAAGLLPLDDEKARADVMRWQCWELSHFIPPTARLISHRLGARPSDPATVRADEDEFRRYAHVLDGHLKDRQFLVGERLTIADFCVASMLMYTEKGNLPLTAFPEIRRWFANIETQPGWLKSAPPPGMT